MHCQHSHGSFPLSFRCSLEASESSPFFRDDDPLVHLMMDAKSVVENSADVIIN